MEQVQDTHCNQRKDINCSRVVIGQGEDDIKEDSIVSPMKQAELTRIFSPAVGGKRKEATTSSMVTRHGRITCQGIIIVSTVIADCSLLTPAL